MKLHSRKSIPLLGVRHEGREAEKAVALNCTQKRLVHVAIECIVEWRQDFVHSLHVPDSRVQLRVDEQDTREHVKVSVLEVLLLDSLPPALRAEVHREFIRQLSGRHEERELCSRASTVGAIDLHRVLLDLFPDHLVVEEALPARPALLRKGVVLLIGTGHLIFKVLLLLLDQVLAELLVGLVVFLDSLLPFGAVRREVADEQLPDQRPQALEVIGNPLLRQRA